MVGEGGEDQYIRRENTSECNGKPLKGVKLEEWLLQSNIPHG